MIRKLQVLAAAVLSAAMASPATAATVTQWLQRYDALVQRDRIKPVAADDPEMKALFLDEVLAEMRSVRAAYNADLANRRRPTVCLPPEGDPKAKFDSREIVDWFRTVVANDPEVTVQKAVVDYLKQRFPCRPDGTNVK